MLSVGTLAGGLGPARAGERLLDGARNAASVEASDRLVADAELITAGLNAMTMEELPALRNSLGLSEAQFDAVLVQEYPQLASNLATLSEGGNALRKTAANLSSISGDFEQADALPLGLLPLPVAALGFVALGIALTACGAVAWRGGPTRWALGAIAGLALVAVVFNLGTTARRKRRPPSESLGG